jgi:hypothetical protein
MLHGLTTIVVIQQVAPGTTASQLTDLCKESNVQVVRVQRTRRKRAILETVSADTYAEQAKLNGRHLNGKPVDVLINTKESNKLRHARNRYANLMRKGDFVCASLYVCENGVLMLWTPPATFALHSCHSPSFADPLTNKRYFLCPTEAMNYACLAFIFERRDEFVGDFRAMQLWNLPFCGGGAEAEFIEDDGGFNPALHDIESWRAFSVPSLFVKKDHKAPTPTLVAVRLRQGAIVFYNVESFANLKRSSLYSITRPFPYTLEEEFVGPGQQPVVLKKLYFTGIVSHTTTSPIMVKIQLLGCQKLKRVQLQELIEHCPRICFDYAMRKQLHHTKGFISLLSRKLQCGQYGTLKGRTKRPTWRDFGAPGCSKCRYIGGCAACFQNRYGPIERTAMAE